MRALKRDHLGIDEPTDVLSFPIDGREPLPDGDAARARRRRPLPAGRRRRVAVAADARAAAPARLRPRRGDGAARASELAATMSCRARQTIFDSFNYAFEGIIHALRTQRNLRIHFVVAIAVLVLALWVGVLEDRADRAADLDHVRADRRDDQHRDRGRDRRRRRRRSTRWRSWRRTSPPGAVLIATINALAVGYLVFSDRIGDRSSRLLEQVRDAPAAADARRARLTVIVVIGDEGLDGPRNAAARRAPVGPRGARVRRLDRRDLRRRRRRTASSSRRSRS